MKIIYSRHAEEQLKERKLSKSLVSKILTKPDQVLSGQKGRRVAQTIVTEDGVEFLVRVVYEEEGDITEVVTVYRTTKIKKYWRISYANKV
jgi:hypothetical protein